MSESITRLIRKQDEEMSFRQTRTQTLQAEVTGQPAEKSQPDPFNSFPDASALLPSDAGTPLAPTQDNADNSTRFPSFLKTE